MVELRLGEKRASQLQNLVGLAQLIVLTFEFLQALQVGRRDAGPGAGVDPESSLLLLDEPVADMSTREQEQTVTCSA